jgi:hypothetical protein
MVNVSRRAGEKMADGTGRSGMRRANFRTALPVDDEFVAEAGRRERETLAGR